MFDNLARIDSVDDYPNSPLNACTLDGMRVQALYTEIGGWSSASFMKRFNDQVTCASILPDLQEHINEINSGALKRTLYVKSGHGTEIPAPPGSSQPRIQLYCPIDIDLNWQNPGIPTDYHYEKAFDSIVDEKGDHGVIMLCCNSGGMLNTYIDDALSRAAKHRDVCPTIKYLRTPWEEQYARDRAQVAALPRKFQKVSDAVFEDPYAKYWYWAATASDTFSYEINSPVYGHGDVSMLFLDHAVRNEPHASRRRIHQRVCEMIRDIYGFDQVPQLWGAPRHLDAGFFE